MKKRHINSLVPVETEICLFVGGPCDGEWFEVMQGSQIAAIPPKFPHCRPNEAGLPCNYRRVELEDDAGKPIEPVYAHEGLAGIKGLFRELVSGYRNPVGG